MRWFGVWTLCFRAGTITLACGYRKAHSSPYKVIVPVSQYGFFRDASLRYASAIKRTYQPKKRYRRRVHGFLRRMSTRGGAHVLRNRRRKGRQRLA
jgi:large subunit ribosomal protein L34